MIASNYCHTSSSSPAHLYPRRTYGNIASRALIPCTPFPQECLSRSALLIDGLRFQSIGARYQLRRLKAILEPSMYTRVYILLLSIRVRIHKASNWILKWWEESHRGYHRLIVVHHFETVQVLEIDLEIFLVMIRWHFRVVTRVVQDWIFLGQMASIITLSFRFSDGLDGC